MSDKIFYRFKYPFIYKFKKGLRYYTRLIVFYPTKNVAHIHITNGVRRFTYKIKTNKVDNVIKFLIKHKNDIRKFLLNNAVDLVKELKGGDKRR